MPTILLTCVSLFYNIKFGSEGYEFVPVNCSKSRIKYLTLFASKIRSNSLQYKHSCLPEPPTTDSENICMSCLMTSYPLCKVSTTETSLNVLSIKK